MDFSVEIKNTVDGYLKADDWKYHFHEDVCIYEMAVKVHNVLSRVSIYICINETSYAVYTQSDLVAKEEQKPALAKWILETNYNMVFGNFDLNWKDGRVRFKCVVDCEGQMPSFDIVRNSLYSGIAMYTQFGETLVELMGE